MYRCKIDGVVFSTKEELVQHMLTTYVEETEVETVEETEESSLSPTMKKFYRIKDVQKELRQKFPSETFYVTPSKNEIIYINWRHEGFDEGIVLELNPRSKGKVKTGEAIFSSMEEIYAFIPYFKKWWKTILKAWERYSSIPLTVLEIKWGHPATTEKVVWLKVRAASVNLDFCFPQEINKEEEEELFSFLKNRQLRI